MESYNQRAKAELKKWKKKIYQEPSLINKSTKGVQNKINAILPKRYHQMMTETIKHMTKAVGIGAEYTTKSPYRELLLIERDDFLKEKSKIYGKVAMVEGAGTGAGGILLGIVDFPLLLSIKIKFLYEVAAIYGFNTDDYKERLYILHIFQLAFSSKEKAKETLMRMERWEDYVKELPYDNKDFNWQAFQQEYRDYLDVAKLLQLIPGIGAVVGAYANTKFIKKLSTVALYAYHMRLL